MPGIIQTVDDMFRSSGAPTKTETEKDFQLSFSGMMGNVKFLVASISAVVVFTIMLLTAATMGMSIRERTVEFGILKSLGFSPRVARSSCPSATRENGDIPIFQLPSAGPIITTGRRAVQESQARVENRNVPFLLVAAGFLCDDANRPHLGTAQDSE